MNQFSNIAPTPCNSSREAFERLFMQHYKPLFYSASKFVEEEATRNIVPCRKALSLVGGEISELFFCN